MQKQQRYFQITIVAIDEMAEDGKFKLTPEIIEESFRVNPLPQLLKLSDVEAFEVGNNFHLHPTPEDLQDHRIKKNQSMRVQGYMTDSQKKD